jgi:hypothetical protein
MGSSIILYLSFRDHVHDVNAGQSNPGAAKRLEPPQESRASLDRTMVLPADELLRYFD